MSKVEGIGKVLSGIGRAVGRGGDDVARAGGRFLPKLGAAGAVGATAAGASWLMNSVNGASQNGGSGGGQGGSGSTSMGGGGMSGNRAGVASSRGFTAPSNDNSARKVSYNPNGNYESESLKLQAASANSLSSIDSTVKNLLRFSVAKATWETRSLRELSIESAGSNGLDASRAAAMSASGSGNSNNGGVSAGLLAGLAAVAGGLFAVSKIRGAMDNSPGGSPGGINMPSMAPGSPLGRAMHTADMGFAGATYAGDARKMLGGAPRAAARVLGAANDNARGGGALQRLSRAAGRANLGSEIGAIARSGGSRGALRVIGFLKGLKSTPVGRFPYVTSAFAAIDPIMAAVESGGQFNDEVKKQLVGAIATIVAGPAGIALGAALGAFIGIPATPVGMAVGAILGGIGGAVAALSAEFVAEQMYDLITGKITLGQFARNLGRGTMNGVRNTAAIAGGAIIGGVAGAIRVARGAAAAAPAAAGAVAGAARGGLRFVAPTARSVAGLAVAGGIGGAALIASQPRAPAAANSTTALMHLQGSELHTAAKNAAEQYLGRGMTAQEWDSLLRAVYGESGRGGAGRENAMIMATMLNRARNPSGYASGAQAQAYLRSGQTVLAILYGTNQFQAVTGTANNSRPSANFTRGPNQNELEGIFRSILQFLHKVPHGQVAFTAASSAAYGAGTNISYRDTMLRNGGITVGGTVFNTAMTGENIPQTAAPAAAPVAAAMAAPTAPNISRGSPAPTGDEGSSGSSRGAPAGPPGPALETLRRYNLKDESHIRGLRGPFADKMARFLEAASGAGKTIKINSGFRSVARQAQLYAAAVAKYGPAGARRWVAPPGASKHNHGLAVDLVYGPNLSSTGAGSGASRDAKAWAHSNASRFGLNFRMGHEPWHIEPTGATIPSVGAAAHAALPRTGGGQNMALGMGASRSMSSVSAPYIGETEGVAPSSPASTMADNIMRTSVEAEKKRMNIVVTQAQTTAAQQTKSVTLNGKTDSSAPESVSSPVMAAYDYATYWGVD